MKKNIILLLIVLCAGSVYAQESTSPEGEKNNMCVTLGILQGGGSLVGADLEVLVDDHLGVQVGAGLVGFGAAINYHFKPGIERSFLALQYWNQGIGDAFSANSLGLAYVFRAKKYFTAQLGLAKTLEQGPAFPSNMDFPPVILTYSVGVFFPF